MAWMCLPVWYSPVRQSIGLSAIRTCWLIVFILPVLVYKIMQGLLTLRRIVSIPLILITINGSRWIGITPVTVFRDGTSTIHRLTPIAICQARRELMKGNLTRTRLITRTIIALMIMLT